MFGTATASPECPGQAELGVHHPAMVDDFTGCRGSRQYTAARHAASGVLVSRGGLTPFLRGERLLQLVVLNPSGLPQADGLHLTLAGQLAVAARQ